MGRSLAFLLAYLLTCLLNLLAYLLIFTYRSAPACRSMRSKRGRLSSGSARTSSRAPRSLLCLTRSPGIRHSSSSTWRRRGSHGPVAALRVRHCLSRCRSPLHRSRRWSRSTSLHSAAVHSAATRSLCDGCAWAVRWRWARLSKLPSSRRAGRGGRRSTSSRRCCDGAPT